MSFLHLWPIYLGAAALALPVAIHWLTRPRPVKFPISTLRFVREAIQQRRARQRLRDFLVLALRTAAILFLAWAMARPLLGDRAAVSVADDENVSRVVVLDVSQSMGAEQHGIQAFERARSRAAEFLAYRRGLRANLIRAGAAARPTFDRLSTNLAALHEELARSRVEPQRLNVQSALSTAAQMLAAAPGAADTRRELIIVSDFQRTNWTAADLSVIPEGTRIQLESVAPSETPPNLAVLGVSVQGRPAAGKDTRLEIEVGNFSPTPKRVHCEITLGQAAYPLEAICPANGKTTLSQVVAMQSAGWQTGEVRLVDADDALAADNARAFVLEVRAPASYALVTRQSPNDTSASSFYLERALAPYSSAERADSVGAVRDNPTNSVRVVRVDPAQLDADSLAASELIILDHPGKLSTVATQLLAGLLRRGRALLWLVAEPVDAINLQQLAAAAGSGLQLPVEFLPPEAGQARRDLFLTDMKQDQSPFQVLGDGLHSAVGSLRFGGGLASRRTESGLADDLVALYSDRSAALVVCSSGAGALAVLNADLAQSNLTASPLFVPLLCELVDRLLGQRQRGPAVASGEPMAVYLPAEAGAIAGLTLVVGVRGATDQPIGELVDEGLGVMWRMPAAASPGVYRVERGRETVFSVATEIPAEESDLRTLAGNVLKERLSGGRSVQYRVAEDDEQMSDDAWTWLSVAAVVCMLVELAALRITRT